MGGENRYAPELNCDTSQCRKQDNGPENILLRKDSNVSLLDLCLFAFDLLISRLRHVSEPTCPASVPDIDEYALFVTWNKTNREGERTQLRGCIGTLTPLNLRRAIHTYTLASAFRDRRFPPICYEELESLSVSVSILHNFLTGSDVYDWQVGVHGVIIDFLDKGSAYSATYLPEVCLEQGWTKEQCISSLIRKSGYRNTISESLLKTIRLTRYSSKKYSLSYSEYLHHRNT
ncbi:AMMECR1 family [Galdieria sulphuraria]|uniref:AMMECR1 family n=1 Tax=Galdieria sulphuraria TaxID=130081 RepID=M2W5A9_GALSU|nr:AMMECR1 family [Galdieria sulphuraria]EME30956.1 AMMECR1 family [Galdieria sulphuraria]|eukprot:XP_005707476.1 AMMECR1 family [Galdieria sulphuraria]